jgi:hypothetical protein
VVVAHIWDDRFSEQLASDERRFKTIFYVNFQWEFHADFTNKRWPMDDVRLDIDLINFSFFSCFLRLFNLSDVLLFLLFIFTIIQCLSNAKQFGCTKDNDDDEN